ncbi:hypothetical protein F5Y04DRAFT_278938 [Hypomontagnella monticulosa]|nr:hypothetical protein F5Y04DRAFT_278938 [Hypomontagnella monticulosa]
MPFILDQGSVLDQLTTHWRSKRIEFNQRLWPDVQVSGGIGIYTVDAQTYGIQFTAPVPRTAVSEAGLRDFTITIILPPIQLTSEEVAAKVDHALQLLRPYRKHFTCVVHDYQTMGVCYYVVAVRQFLRVPGRTHERFVLWKRQNRDELRAFLTDPREYWRNHNRPTLLEDSHRS